MPNVSNISGQPRDFTKLREAISEEITVTQDAIDMMLCKLEERCFSIIDEFNRDQSLTSTSEPKTASNKSKSGCAFLTSTPRKSKRLLAKEAAAVAGDDVPELKGKKDTSSTSKRSHDSNIRNSGKKMKIVVSTSNTPPLEDDVKDTSFDSGVSSLSKTMGGTVKAEDLTFLLGFENDPSEFRALLSFHMEAFHVPTGKSVGVMNGHVINVNCIRRWVSCEEFYNSIIENTGASANLANFATEMFGDNGRLRECVHDVIFVEEVEATEGFRAKGIPAFMLEMLQRVRPGLLVTRPAPLAKVCKEGDDEWMRNACKKILKRYLSYGFRRFSVPPHRGADPHPKKEYWEEYVYRVPMRRDPLWKIEPNLFSSSQGKMSEADVCCPHEKLMNSGPSILPALIEMKKLEYCYNDSKRFFGYELKDSNEYHEVQSFVCVYPWDGKGQIFGLGGTMSSYTLDGFVENSELYSSTDDSKQLLERKSAEFADKYFDGLPNDCLEDEWVRIGEYKGFIVVPQAITKFQKYPSKIPASLVNEIPDVGRLVEEIHCASTLANIVFLKECFLFPEVYEAFEKTLLWREHISFLLDPFSIVTEVPVLTEIFQSYSVIDPKEKKSSCLDKSRVGYFVAIVNESKCDQLVYLSNDPEMPPINALDDPNSEMEEILTGEYKGMISGRLHCFYNRNIPCPVHFGFPFILRDEISY
eukprot:Nk52_evm36s232 gene=Nk52_evmTU36s232